MQAVFGEQDSLCGIHKGDGNMQEKETSKRRKWETQETQGTVLCVDKMRKEIQGTVLCVVSHP